MTHSNGLKPVVSEKEEEQIVVKFSHDYPKLGNTDTATLLDVWIMDTKEFSADFVNYDTVYVDLKGIQHYPLPKGKVLVLLLHSPEAYLFTTVRRFTPQKHLYYSSHIGELVKIKKEMAIPPTTKVVGILAEQL